MGEYPHILIADKPTKGRLGYVLAISLVNNQLCFVNNLALNTCSLSISVHSLV